MVVLQISEAIPLAFAMKLALGISSTILLIISHIFFFFLRLSQRIFGNSATLEISSPIPLKILLVISLRSPSSIPFGIHLGLS